MNTSKKMISLLALGVLSNVYANAPQTKTTEAKTEVKPKAPAAAAAAPRAGSTTSIAQVANNAQVQFDLNVRSVNTMEAMQTSKQGAAMAAELEKKRVALAEEIKQLEQTITKEMTEFQSKKTAMTTQAANAEEAKIMKMRRDFESTVKSSEEELRLAMQQATEELSINVEKAIVEIAKAEGYDIVTDMYTGRTLYASPKATITTDLVKVMDQKYVASNTKPTEAKKAVTA